MNKFILKILLLIFTSSLCAETISGRVVGIADGDTITVLVSVPDQSPESHKIRLWGIDAPEKKQPFGQTAKKYLSGLVFDKLVRVEVKDIDRYGRMVGIVFDNETDVNLEMIKAGLAWCYRYYSKDQRYIDAETSARMAKAGLWSEPNPVAPWDWRRNRS